MYLYYLRQDQSLTGVNLKEALPNTSDPELLDEAVLKANLIYRVAIEEGKELQSVTYNSQTDSVDAVWLAPMPLPDWQGFLNGMDVTQLGGNGLFQKGLETQFALFSTLYTVILRLLDKGSLANNSVPEWRTFFYLYSQALQIYTAEEVEQIEALMTSCLIPIPGGES